MKHSISKNIKELVKTLKLAWPIALAQLSHVVLHMMDAIMVGELGKVPLAASSFSIGIFAIPLVFAFGISSVLSSLIGKAIGEKSFLEVGQIFRHGLIVCAVIAISAVLIFEILLPHLALFGQPTDVTKMSVVYLRYLSWSLIPLCIFFVYVKFCEGVSHPAPVTMVSWLAVVMNIFLNWVFIFGNLGFEALGLEGAGLATFLARVIILLLIIFYVHSAKRYKKYNPSFRFKNFSKSLLKKIFSLGLPAGFQGVNEVAAFVGGGIMMGWLGATELAAHMVGINLASSTFILAMSIGFASTVRVGEAFGRKNPQQIFSIGVSAFVFVFLLMILSGSFFYGFREQLPFLYIREISVAQLATKLLIMAAVFQVFDGLQSLGIALTRGILDVKIPLWITIFCYWILCLPLSYGLTFKLEWGAFGIWSSYIISLAVASVLLNWRFFYLVDRMKKNNPSNLC